MGHRATLLLLVLLSTGAMLGVQAGVAALQPAPLTEIEALRVQNVNLERVIVQRALDDWKAKVAALKADLEKARPGWTWDPDTGKWTAQPPPSPK